MYATVLVLSVLATQPGTAGVSPEQFSRILQGALSEIRDVSFMYEGIYRLEIPNIPGKTDAELEQYRIKNRRQYQGLYSWRGDGSERVDYYLQTGGPDNVRYYSFSLFGGKTISLIRDADRRFGPVYDDHEKQNTWLLSDFTPHNMNYLWYYKDLGDPGAQNYRDLGWEDVDGHHCLKVRIDNGKMAPSEKNPYTCFWIDTERGGHPLRVEKFYWPPFLAGRVYSIELKKIDLRGGKHAWLPISGIEDTFVTGIQEHSQEPVYHVVSRVLPDTIRVNEGIPDSAFALRIGDPPRSDDRVLRRNFDAAYAKSPPPERTDPKSVEERLTRRLEEADRQSAMIDASSSSQGSWSATLLAQIGFFSAGAALITWATMILRRSR